MKETIEYIDYDEVNRLIAVKKDADIEAEKIEDEWKKRKQASIDRLNKLQYVGVVGERENFKVKHISKRPWLIT